MPKIVICLFVYSLMAFISCSAQASNDNVKKIDVIARDIQAIQQQLNAANEKLRQLYKNESPVQHTTLRNVKPAIHIKKAKHSHT